MATTHRISFTEFGIRRSVDATAKELGISSENLVTLCNRTEHRIADALGVSKSIMVGREGLQFCGVAGLLRVGPRLEFEIVPKCVSPDSVFWREDFFAIASLSRYGRILPNDSINTQGSAESGLADLMGFAMINLWQRCAHHPIRTYGQRRWTDFRVSGDLDPESLLDPPPDGFSQDGLALDRENPFNGLIRESLDLLSEEVRSQDLRRQLLGVRGRLGVSSRGNRGLQRHALPPRYHEWQDLFQLAEFVVSGSRASFSLVGPPGAPGYLMATAPGWEHLIRMGLRLALGNSSVSKATFTLGARLNPVTPTPVAASAPRATPDVTVRDEDGRIRYLVDAKYKTSFDAESRGVPHIDASDLYEALAFLRAAETNRIGLVYPAASLGGSRPGPTGEVHAFEQIDIGDQRVLGLAVDVDGISRSGGLHTFSTTLCAGLESQLG